jgi:hypothetical protein
MSFEASLRKIDVPPVEHPRPAIQGGIRIAILAVSGLALFLVGRWSANTGKRSPPAMRVDRPTLSLVKVDNVTKGSWRGVYGSEGFAIATEKATLPPYAQVRLPRDTSVLNNTAASEVRALQESADPVNRIASAWYSFSDFDIDIDFTDGRTHQVALYMMDWDSTSRREIIRLTDTTTSRVLDEREVSAFNGGRYLVWNLTGHITVKVLRVAGANAVVSALFFN